MNETIMTTREAIDLVMAYGTDIGANSMLDCIEKLETEYKAGELSCMMSSAYLIFINEMDNLCSM
jgi:hypothetical protein